MKVDTVKMEIAMANKCMSTTKLSQKTNLNYSTLTRIKATAKANPTTVGKIAKALGVRVEDLIEMDAATSCLQTKGSESN